MTHKDIYTKFMIEYDKANITSSYPSLTKYEVATLLDKAYLALIAQKMTGNNPRKVGFEDDVKAIHDLQQLVVSKILNKQQDINVAINEYSYSLPNDILYYISGQIGIANDTVTSILNKKLTGNKLQLIAHKNADQFRASTTNLPWIKNPVCFVEHDALHVLIDPLINKLSTTDEYVYLTYIKKPTSFTIGKITEKDPEEDVPDEPSTPEAPKTITWTYLDYDDRIIDVYENLSSGDISNKYVPENPKRENHVFQRWFPNIPMTVGTTNIAFKAYYAGENIPDSDEPVVQYATVSVDSYSLTESPFDVCGYVTGGGVYQIGHLCVLTATPKAEDSVYTYEFSNWSKDDEYFYSTRLQLIFTVTKDDKYVANFTRTLKQPSSSVDNSTDYWADLGLPSGTLWAKRYNNDSSEEEIFVCTKDQLLTILNEMGLSQYDLPNVGLWLELKYYCSHLENDGKVRYTGPNGNYIEFDSVDGKTDVSQGIIPQIIKEPTYLFFDKGDYALSENYSGITLFNVKTNTATSKNENKKEQTLRVRPVKRNYRTLTTCKVLCAAYPLDSANIRLTGYFDKLLPSYAYWNTFCLMTVAPKTGYKFLKWDDGNTDGTRTIHVLREVDLKAICVPATAQSKYHVKVLINDEELGYIFFPVDLDYDVGSIIAIRVIAKDDCEFIGWSDGEPSTTILTAGSAEEREFFVDRDIDVTAIFRKKSTT